MGRPLRAAHARAAFQSLTRREQEVLSRVVEGQKNKQISAALGISEATVKSHMRTIVAKLNVADRTQAVTVAHRRGIILL